MRLSFAENITRNSQCSNFAKIARSGFGHPRKTSTSLHLLLPSEHSTVSVGLHSVLHVRILCSTEGLRKALSSDYLSSGLAVQLQTVMQPV